MIEQYWGLSRKPFTNTPDPAFLFRSPGFEEGFARLLYDVTELRSGLSLVTGEVGCGKTMLASSLADRLRGTPHEITTLLTPRLTGYQLLLAIAESFGVTAPPRAKHALLAALERRLAEHFARGRRPVLLIDEAQLVSPATLEEIRLLTNLESATEKYLHIVLLGQPELRRRVTRRPQLNQRVSLRYHLEPLEAPEVGQYVAHRLKVAGATDREIFRDDAIGVLADRSDGVPRLVNNLAIQSLFVGAMRRAPSIDASLVSDIADDRE